jgi:hypothetical protein
MEARLIFSGAKFPRTLAVVFHEVLSLEAESCNGAYLLIKSGNMRSQFKCIAGSQVPQLGLHKDGQARAANMTVMTRYQPNREKNPPLMESIACR